MIEFVRFFTYALLVVVACVTVYCGVKFIEYSWNVIVSKTPPFVPANSIERAVKSLGMPHSRRDNAVRDKYFVFFMVFDTITTIK